MQEHAKKVPEPYWIEGMGYVAGKIGGHPTVEDMDKISTTRCGSVLAAFVLAALCKCCCTRTRTNTLLAACARAVPDALLGAPPLSACPCLPVPARA